MDRDTVAIVLQAKSVAMAILLTLFFGGLGVFYVSIPGGIFMSILTVMVWIISFVTFGIAGIFLIPLIHGISIIWGIVGVNNHNKKLTSTYLKGDAGTVQAAAPPVPTEPQIPPRSESPVQEPTSDPQVVAKHQAYRIRIAKDPGNVALLGEYGDFLARLGNVDEALIQYFTIVELQPEDTSTRRKIAEVYKRQNNIPKAAAQLHQILQIRQDDIEAQEELAQLYPPILGDKLPYSLSSPQGQIPGPAPLPESVKTKGTKKPGLFIAGAVGGAVLIAIAIFFFKQKQPVNFPDFPPSEPGKVSGITQASTPNPPKPVAREMMQTIPDPIADTYIGTWEYYVDGGKSYLKITKVESGRYKFEAGYKWEGNIVWTEFMLKDADGIYLKLSDGKMIGEFVSANFGATHGMDFLYKITLDIKSDNKLLYSVYSELSKEPNEMEATKISN